MADAIQVISQQGPLPITTTFQAANADTVSDQNDTFYVTLVY